MSILGVRYLLSPVRAQQQISTTRKGICAPVPLISVPTPRLNRLKTRKNRVFGQDQAPCNGPKVNDLLRFKITKQVVQMHSTATDVRKLVERENSLARTLIRFNFGDGMQGGDHRKKIRSDLRKNKGSR
jgi:hypothetical protein